MCDWCVRQCMRIVNRVDFAFSVFVNNIVTLF